MRLFLSYRRADSDAMVGRIYDRLEAHFGIKSIFMDIDTIPVGAKFEAYILDEISRTDIVLAIIGDGWLSALRKRRWRRDYIRMELVAAFDNGIPVLPVIVGQTARMPSKRELPRKLRFLASLNAAYVSSGIDFDTHIDRLIRGIETTPISNMDGAAGKDEIEITDEYKYFYYISRTKLAMLGPQVGIGYRTLDDNDYSSLVKEAVRLNGALYEEGMAKRITNPKDISTNRVYEETGVWHQGLFSFNTHFDAAAVTYALWAAYGSTLIFLVGSPNHILGEKVVSSGLFVPGTSGAHLAILEFCDRFLRTDEPHAVRTGPDSRYGHKNIVPLDASSSKITFQDNSNTGLIFQENGIDRFDINDAIYAEEDARGLYLAILCLDHMRNLPQMKINLLFTLFSEHTVMSPLELEKRARSTEYEWLKNKLIKSAEVLGSQNPNIESVFFGSPIYTAFSDPSGENCA